jgi:hypothetical protein
MHVCLESSVLCLLYTCAMCVCSSTASPSEDRSQRNAEDLRRLVGGPRLPAAGGGGRGDVADEDDMPPLLQAVTRSPKHDDARRRIDQQLAALEARERKREKEDWYAHTH